MPKVVILNTSAAKMPNGHPTGVWLEETAAPYYLFKEAGFAVTLASVAGGPVPIDAGSLGAGFFTDAAKKFMHDPEAFGALSHSVPLADVDTAAADCLYLAGGHGTCVDFANNPLVKAKIEAAYAAGKVVAADCHGPIALAQCVGPDGEPLVKGKEVTGFSNSEEAAVGLTDAVPFLIETKFKDLGANYTAGADWNSHACVSGKLVTGQNPQSSEACAKACISLIATKNAAFVFIKPHAVTDKVISLVKGYLAGRGIAVLTEGQIAGEVIDEKKLIDQHYYAIASKATILTPDQLNVPADKFKGQFGLEWADALKTGDVVNAMDACKRFACSSDDLDAAWGKAKKAKQLVKFGGGFYCGLIEMNGSKLYVFNGFFMSMRSKFTAPGTSIYYFSVEWDAGSLAWEDFRGAALGPTDPADAPADALRGMVLADWKGLGLAEVPNVGDNGVHASASPFEALAERMNWLGADATTDTFGKACLAAGLDEPTLKAWSVDPQVNLPGGGKGSLFDSVEDMDAEACLAKLLAIKACA